jgi:S-adenosylmethionine synthetase
MAMDLILEPANTVPPGAEVVERKGLGHPDTICDALAESLSQALSRYYRDTFGVILHHNVDKALLVGGAARPAFDGGEILEPIEIYLAGRAVDRAGNETVPVRNIAMETARRWLMDNLPHLDVDRHVRLHCRIRPGSVELRDLFQRRRGGPVLANDTSCGIGYAPLSLLERMVLAVERDINAPAFRAAHPEGGEDVKIMGLRGGRDSVLSLTVARAFIGRHLSGRAAYEEAKTNLASEARRIAAAVDCGDVRVAVNTADGESDDQIYLTVTGTSGEAGDDGEVGRGNRINGLITPGRPMSLEAVAGKNPVSHVGKLYNLAAGEIARDIVVELADVTYAEVSLVSAIGRPIDQPQFVRLGLITEDGAPVAPLHPHAAEIVATHLAGLDMLQDRFVSGAAMVW